MMLKIVYGPPPANSERIEGAEAEPEPDSALVRETTEKEAMAGNTAQAGALAAGLDRQPE